MQTDALTLHTKISTAAESLKIPVHKSLPFRQTLPLALALLALWLVLSGELDAFHLSMGVVSALAISLGTRRLLMLPPAIGPHGAHPVAAYPWLRLLIYIPWLIWQIVLSSIHIAYVVLHPRMPISPRLIHVQAKLPHALARLTLANSITLTPGTVTVDVQGDDFLIHALTEASAAGLQGEDTMQKRVAELYRDVQPPPNPGVTV